MADRNGYIGRAPGDSSVTVARQNYTASGITTDFTFNSGYVVGYFDLYINGVKMIEGSDYTSSDGSTFTVLNGGASDGDVLEAVAYKAFNLGDARRIGIQSGGVTVGSVDTLNFIGVGNTFLLNGTTIDVSISGSAGAAGTWATFDSSTGISTTKKVLISNDLNVTGVATATTFSGNITGVAATFSGNVSIAGTLTYEDVTNVDSIGVVTARSGIRVGSGQSIGSDGADVVYYGDGSQLSGISAGLTTEALSGGFITLDLTNQDHKITATGITTLTVSGGTEGDSHTVRIINSGIATVGFSTYFLFPSGSPPALPTADGTISLISFTINRVGAGGTQLLAGASLNFS